MGHDRHPPLEAAGESHPRPARNSAASRLPEPADCGARRKTDDHDEGPEPRAAPVQSPSPPSGARRPPCLRALGRTRHDRLQAGDAEAGHRGVPASRPRACASSRNIGRPEASELAICLPGFDVIVMVGLAMSIACLGIDIGPVPGRSEEHTSELQSLMRISYAVFCLKKKTNQIMQRSTE